MHPNDDDFVMIGVVEAGSTVCQCFVIKPTSMLFLNFYPTAIAF